MSYYSEFFFLLFLAHKNQLSFLQKNELPLYIEIFLVLIGSLCLGYKKEWRNSIGCLVEICLDSCLLLRDVKVGNRMGFKLGHFRSGKIGYRSF